MASPTNNYEALDDECDEEVDYDVELYEEIGSFFRQNSKGSNHPDDLMALYHMFINMKRDEIAAEVRKKESESARNTVGASGVVVSGDRETESADPPASHENDDNGSSESQSFHVYDEELEETCTQELKDKLLVDKDFKLRAPFLLPGKMESNLHTAYLIGFSPADVSSALIVLIAQEDGKSVYYPIVIAGEMFPDAWTKEASKYSKQKYKSTSAFKSVFEADKFEFERVTKNGRECLLIIGKDSACFMRNHYIDMGFQKPLLNGLITRKGRDFYFIDAPIWFEEKEGLPSCIKLYQLDIRKSGEKDYFTIKEDNRRSLREIVRNIARARKISLCRKVENLSPTLAALSLLEDKELLIDQKICECLQYLLSGQSEVNQITRSVL